MSPSPPSYRLELEDALASSGGPLCIPHLDPQEPRWALRHDDSCWRHGPTKPPSPPTSLQSPLQPGRPPSEVTLSPQRAAIPAHLPDLKHPAATLEAGEPSPPISKRETEAQRRQKRCLLLSSADTGVQPGRPWKRFFSRNPTEEGPSPEDSVPHHLRQEQGDQPSWFAWD